MVLVSLFLFWYLIAIIMLHTYQVMHSPQLLIVLRRLLLFFPLKKRCFHVCTHKNYIVLQQHAYKPTHSNELLWWP